MAHKFCHNCGKSLSVGSNFCNGCGTDLKSLSASPSKLKIKDSELTFVPFSNKGNKDDDDEDEYIDKIEHLDIKINGLELEINNRQAPVESFASVMAQGGSQSQPVPSNNLNALPPPQPINNEAFLKDWQQQAGALRPADRNRTFRNEK